jgi:prophage regulatory protein
MVDIKESKTAFGLRASSVLYGWVAAGTMPPPIKLSAKCSRWFASEIKAIAAARAAGRTEGELRHLVEALCARRKALASGAPAAGTAPATNGAQP